jgi:ATP-dependent Clp protease adaptor protein ClpS
MREISMVTMREHKSNRPEQHAASDVLSELLAEVRLLNDDQTTMEFVVHVLEKVLGKDRETATRIMLEAHNEGFGVCGIYPCDIAEAKVTEVISFASRHGHPLQCVLERSIFRAEWRIGFTAADIICARSPSRHFSRAKLRRFGGRSGHRLATRSLSSTSLAPLPTNGVA